MLKQHLIAGFMSVLLLGAGATTAQPSYAQTPEPAPEAQNQEPAAPAPEPAAAEVTADEVQQFTNAVRQIQVIQGDSRIESIAAIEDSGLTTERFNEILEIRQTPEEQADASVPDEELQSFEQALTQVAEIQETARSQMQAVIQAEGLDIQRFNQIFAMVRENPELRQEVQEMLQTDQ